VVDVFACDITEEASCMGAARQAEAQLGAPFALVNLAGGSGPIGKTGVETTREEFHDILDLNTTGIFNMIRAVAPAMMREGRGGSSTWAAPSACGGAPGGWPIRPRNGVCAA
jgi:NAD(P)-dependent dehydrogenase (short-subunit alcohol dehydrogenase family)